MTAGYVAGPWYWACGYVAALVPAPGGGTRMFLLIPGLGLFRAELPAGP